MNLHIQRDGQQYGHYSLEEARALLAEGKLLPGDLARPDGATDWKPLSTLPGFSTPPALPSSAPKRRRRMPLPISIGLCLLGLLVVTFLIWRIHLASQINARLAAIKAAGYPVNATELDEWYEAVPENENAALIVVQAIGQLKTNGLNSVWPDIKLLRALPRTSPLSDILKEHYSERVAANRAALAVLHKVTTRPKSRYPIDCTQGTLTRLPHLSRIKISADLLRDQAMLHTEKGNPAGAAESVQTGLALGRSLKNEPFVISQTTRVGVNYVICDALERCVNRVILTDEQLAALGSSLNQSDDTSTMSRALAGERASYVEYFRVSAKVRDVPSPSGNPEEEPASLPLTQQDFALTRWTGMFERDFWFCLTSMETNIAVAARPAPESLIMTKLVDAQSLEAKTKYYILSRLCLPQYGRVAHRAARDSACLRTAATAMAVERFRLAHQNQPPDSLAALVPAYLKSVPTDPFDGQPLRYKRLEKGYVIYSIGDDLKDDGGTGIKRNAKGNMIPNSTYDIPFTVER